MIQGKVHYNYTTATNAAPTDLRTQLDAHEDPVAIAIEREAARATILRHVPAREAAGIFDMLDL